MRAIVPSSRPSRASSRPASGRVGLGAILATLAIAAAPAHANLLTNGSFETPVVPVGGYTNYMAGSTAITGWTVVGVDSSVTSGSFMQSGITFEAQDGAQWIDLAGVTSNSMSSGVTQTIATVAGSTYEVSFYVGSTTDGVFFFPTTVDLSIDGGPRSHFFNPASPRTSLDWERFTADFVANGPATTITFLNGDDGNNYSTALDNASVDLVDPTVAGVPEPHELALLAAGAVAFGSLRRRRRG